MSTVINLRGTGGSGKSTVVRRVMERYPHRIPLRVAGRRQPGGYSLSADGSRYTLFVPGHYETACGGCDTIKTVDEVYRLVRVAEFGDPELDVVYEGIMTMDDVRRAAELHQQLSAAGGSLTVIGLTTPVELCLDAIRTRRLARGDERPLDPKNTVARAASQVRIQQRLREAGVVVEQLDREAAFARCCTLLRLTPGS